jgi:cell division transport system permease protein
MNRRLFKAPLAADAPGNPAPAGSAGPRDGFGWRAWRRHHRQSALAAWRRLAQHKAASLLTISVSGIALALPLVLLGLIGNVQGLAGQLRSSGEIAVFLTPGLPISTVATLADRLRAEAGVAAVKLQSPEQGLAELKTVPDFAEAIAALDRNPLPYVLLIRPQDQAVTADLLERLRGHPEIEQIQHDADWQRRLQRVLALLQRLSELFMLLFGGGALLLIAHGVRLEVQSRAAEIGIVKLLGASDAFVRRPFLWSGFWFGLHSALFALILVWVLGGLLQAPVAALAQSYGSGFTLQAPSAIMAAATLAAGVLLGSTGAFLACTLQLIADRARFSS